MAAALHCLSSASTSCFALPVKRRPLSIPAAAACCSQPLKPLSFSASVSFSAFPNGGFLVREVEKKPLRWSIVCDATTKKADSAAKRARQSEKRRIYNKGKKSEIRTRMRKVFEALDELKKKTEAQSEEIIPVEKLIAEAYSAIDKAVKSGTLHRNTGANRKSRLARRKKTVEIHHGWYAPTPAAVSA